MVRYAKLSSVEYAKLSNIELVRACANSKNEGAWAEFLGRFHEVIGGTILRTARQWVEPSRELIDDLVQDTYLKLCDNNNRLLAGFRPEHEWAIYGFLKVVAA